jgi:putative phosphoesterase
MDPLAPLRIAFVTDIHGNLPALEAVVHDIARRGVDRVVNLGDSLSGPLLPLETARYLMARDWFHLAGNHERQILSSGSRDSDAYARSMLGDAELAWIASQKPMAALAAGVFVCHGTPASDIEHLLETIEERGRRAATRDEVEERCVGVEAALVVCGHSHLPRMTRTSKRLVVNPGSVGLPAFDDDLPFTYTVENHSPDARYAIAERIDGRWSATLVAVPYDFEPMASLAEARGRPEWAGALRTGEMPR